MRAGKLIESVAFDEPGATPDAFGGVLETWAERFRRRAQLVYQSGNEAVQAARLAGRSIYKMRVRACGQTRMITTDWRARDVRRGTVWNIREVDSVTDRFWVHVVIEGEIPQ